VLPDCPVLCGAFLGTWLAVGGVATGRGELDSAGFATSWRIGPFEFCLFGFVFHFFIL
jgi:hypothetical protein